MKRWLLLFVLGCGNGSGGAIGDRCRGSDECDEGLCFVAGDSEARCMASCMADQRLCASGEVCVEVEIPGEVPEAAHLCFLGGEAGLGERCETGADCESGAVCILAEVGQPGVCRLACDVRVGGCGDQACTPIGEDTRDGFCGG